MYIFYGGTANHPCRGLKCSLGWKFKTSESYMVYFENDPRGIGFEIAFMNQLKFIEE